MENTPPPRSGADQASAVAQGEIKPVWPFVLLAIAALPLGLFVGAVLASLLSALIVMGSGRSEFFVPEGYLGLPLVIALLIFSIRAAVRVSSRNKKIRGALPATPLGHTTAGQPIYPVVGYTPDGQPVTADRAVGYQPAAGGTNSMSIVALITGLTVAPLGIIFGIIALSQINKTGQHGRGFAIAGVVLGSISILVSITLIGIASGYFK